MRTRFWVVLYAFRPLVKKSIFALKGVYLSEKEALLRGISSLLTCMSSIIVHRNQRMGGHIDNVLAYTDGSLFKVKKPSVENNSHSLEGKTMPASMPRSYVSHQVLSDLIIVLWATYFLYFCRPATNVSTY